MNDNVFSKKYLNNSVNKVIDLACSSIIVIIFYGDVNKKNLVDLELRIYYNALLFHEITFVVSNLFIRERSRRLTKF